MVESVTKTPTKQTHVINYRITFKWGGHIRSLAAAERASWLVLLVSFGEVLVGINLNCD